MSYEAVIPNMPLLSRQKKGNQICSDRIRKIISLTILVSIVGMTVYFLANEDQINKFSQWVRVNGDSDKIGSKPLRLVNPLINNNDEDDDESWSSQSTGVSDDEEDDHKLAYAPHGNNDRYVDHDSRHQEIINNADNVHENVQQISSNVPINRRPSKVYIEQPAQPLTKLPSNTGEEEEEEEEEDDDNSGHDLHKAIQHLKKQNEHLQSALEELNSKASSSSSGSSKRHKLYRQPSAPQPITFDQDDSPATSILHSLLHPFGGNSHVLWRPLTSSSIPSAFVTPSQ